MKKIQALLPAMILVYCLTGCSGGAQKKVLVMVSGKVQIADNVITLQPGTTHTETILTDVGDKLTIKTPSGSSEVSVPDGGLYILNLKKDTLVGSFQRIGSDNSQQVITQENLRTRIDSLNQLMAGTNVNSANRNYSIPPNQITKVSSNTEAQIIGPYKKIPGSFEAGKEHEVYKFYTSKEMQEIVGNLTKMVEPVPGE